ncbi:MAG: hypothetical protein V7746_14200 [Halioglobus sp.]
MSDQLKSSVILLTFLGVLFSIPLVSVGFSVHGSELAMLAAVAVIVLVFLGPLSFLFASSIATDIELGLMLVFGIFILLTWVKALSRGTGYYVPYFPVICWALMGAYFCVSLFFVHAA